MIPENFLRDFLRSPDDVDESEGVAFLKRCLGESKLRDTLLCWMAAASRAPFLPGAAAMLLRALLEDAPPSPLPGAESAVNIVGTGGGRATFNVSTAAAFVAASCGIKVIKTGSHAYAGRCGALDVLTELGVVTNASMPELADQLSEFRLVFVPPSHYAKTIRALAVQLAPMPLKVTGQLLNLIGPLLNPYRVGAQITGVARADMLHDYAGLVSRHDHLRPEAARMWIVHAECGMDELCSLSANSVVALGTAPAAGPVVPTRFGFEPNADLQSLAPATSNREAATLVETILSGNGKAAPTQTVALNAAAAIRLGNGARDLEDAYRQAIDSLESGAPADLLMRLRAACAERRAPIFPAATPHAPHQAIGERS